MSQLSFSMRPEQEDRYVRELLRHQDAIYAFIQLLLPWGPDAEDVYQETCLTLWRIRADFDAEREFLPWARGVARNEVRRFCKQHRKERVLFSDEMMELLSGPAEAEPQASVSHVLNDCLAKMRANQRDLLKRCYSGQESIRQVASSLSTSASALYMRLHRLRRVLARCMKAEMKAEMS